LLALSGMDYRLLPVVSLLCNLVVVSGGTLRFARAGITPWRGALGLTAIAAPAEGERQRVEQDRLARAGLAREHGETLVEGNVEPFDENDVADRKMNEHDRDRRY